MIAVDQSKFSTLFTKVSSSSEVGPTVCSLISGLGYTYWKTKIVWNIEWLLRKLFNLSYDGPSNFSICLNIPTKSGQYIKRFVIVNRYIDQVIPWRCLSCILHCTYTLGGKHRSIQYCSSLLHYRRLSCDVVCCRTQEVEI